MKVLIVSERYKYPGRAERLNYIMEEFQRYGSFEFIAFDVDRQSFVKRGLHILKVNRGDEISKCISYMKGVIGQERFFVVMETAMEGTDIGRLLYDHKKSGMGITVAARREADGSWKNLGIALLENEYLDLICDGAALEPDIMVDCAENGELGICYS